MNYKLEDHPRTCKWLIAMVGKSPIPGVVGPLPNGLNGSKWPIIWGDPNHLLTGMIRQVATGSFWTGGNAGGTVGNTNAGATRKPSKRGMLKLTKRVR